MTFERFLLSPAGGRTENQALRLNVAEKKHGGE